MNTVSDLITGPNCPYCNCERTVKKRCSAVLGRQRRQRGSPPETKPDYVEPLWLVGYADAWLKLEARPRNLIRHRKPRLH